MEAASRALFGQGELGDLDAATLAAALREAPHARVNRPLPPVAELLVATGLDASRSQERGVARPRRAHERAERRALESHRELVELIALARGLGRECVPALAAGERATCRLCRG